MKLNQTERLFAAVKPIDVSPDWSVNDRAGDNPITKAAEQAALAIIEQAAGEALGGAGLAMRGISRALAASFDEDDLERGMASSLRGVRNAFAERWAEVRRRIELLGRMG